MNENSQAFILNNNMTIKILGEIPNTITTVFASNPTHLWPVSMTTPMSHCAPLRPHHQSARSAPTPMTRRGVDAVSMAEQVMPKIQAPLLSTNNTWVTLVRDCQMDLSLSWLNHCQRVSRKNKLLYLVIITEAIARFVGFCFLLVFLSNDYTYVKLTLFESWNLFGKYFELCNVWVIEIFFFFFTFRFVVRFFFYQHFKSIRAKRNLKNLTLFV